MNQFIQFPNNLSESGGTASGTVTSVGFASSGTLFNVLGSPITGAGTITLQATSTIVTGPQSSTLNAIPTWNSTSGASLQNSIVTIDASGNLNTTGSLAASSAVTIGTGSADSANVFAARKDQNGATILHATNGSTGASAQVELKLSAADDAYLYSTGANNGAQVLLSSGSNHVGGLNFESAAGGSTFKVDGNNSFVLKTNNATALTVAGDQSAIFTGGLGINNSAPDGTNILNIRKDQNAPTAIHVTNASTGGSGEARIKLTSSLDDFIIGSESALNGAQGYLQTSIGLTNGINISATTGGITLDSRGVSSIVMKTNGTNVLTLASSQAATFTSTITTSGGNFVASSAGTGLQIKGGSNSRVGTGTLSSGAATISNTSVTSNTRVFLTDTAGGILANIGSLYVSATSAGTSFSVASTNITDNSNFNWFLVEQT